LAPKNFGEHIIAWTPNHFIPYFPNNIQYLVKVAANCFFRPSKALADDPKPLVITNYMEEHGNLFLHTSIDIVLDQTPLFK